ncbi:amino acid ABC transporter substrate-binding protein [Pelagibacterium luteolum]|uniref:General L-amino acid transport system substrate-binding protein n=1 Tax=Pelagibacterium luteolum TaxID=440168 RepID=A0A1G7WBD5_9HYPH|nr:amino acid ABC transporter substrate-binding protein [Pelagibacterium luteolum]SDG69317.1 general L-amino acid transport system substrate-binding protein [Pelagibacterium luteolum]
MLQAKSRSLRILASAALWLTLGLGASGTVHAQDQAAPAAAPFTISTLETVRARGYVTCAATSPLPGFAQISPEGLWSGFDIDVCRAVAAAVFGDPSKVEFRPLSGEGRFAHLAMGEVDLISRNAPWTMSRDTSYGATYVATTFFDGQGFMVPGSLGVVSAFELEDVTVCVAGGSEAEMRMEEFFFQNQLAYDTLVYEDRDDLAIAYRSGRCDAITASASWLQAMRRSLPEPGSHNILPERLSKEAFGPVVRSNDKQWETIVRWTLFALVNAEELGVTSSNIESMLAAQTPAIRRLLGIEGNLGEPLGLRRTWMRDVIAAVGNYGEVYARHFGSGSNAALLRGQNALWINGGLLFAPPFT